MMIKSEVIEIKLRVWHIPQVPSNNPFRVEVKNIDEAVLILKTLWNYDSYQFVYNIKPDYSNASGLEYFDKDTRKWEEYYDEEDNDIDAIIKEREVK
jgi:hypothetical protein